MSKAMTPRVALILIAALFIVPLMLAWMMYSGVIEFRPGSTRNLGRLVEPPVPLAWEGVRVRDESGFGTEDFIGHWLVLHAVPEPCGDECVEAVVGLRQVHLAAGRNRSRIRLGLLHDGAFPADAQWQQIYPEFHLLEDRGGAAWRELRNLTRDLGPGASVPGATYLVDPLGNIMMFYAPGFDPNDLKKDLKRLLTWSKLDEDA